MTTQRRGFTLIEILAALTTGILVVTVCAGLIHALMRLEKLGRNDLENTVTLSRLARDVRSDVHSAWDVDVGDQTLTLRLPEDARIEYHRAGDDLIRTLQHEDESPRFEAYRLPRGTEVHWEVEPFEASKLICLSLHLPVGTKDAPSTRTIRIESALGRDHRFEEVDR